MAANRCQWRESEESAGFVKPSYKCLLTITLPSPTSIWVSGANVVCHTYTWVMMIAVHYILSFLVTIMK